MEAKNNKETETKETKKENAKKEVWGYVKIIIIAALIALFCNKVLIANVKIPSESMLDTIHVGDRLIGSRLAYKFSDVERGDIAIFKYPDDESQVFIKRVIGLPGETVEIRDGKVYIDDSDTPLDEPYVKGVPTGDYGPYVVPDGCYFMMGDNRGDSLDSRFWNNTYVKENKIIAKALFRYFPKPGKIE